MRYHVKIGSRVACLAAGIILAFGGVPSIAQTPPPKVHSQQLVRLITERTQVDVVEKFVKVFELKSKISRVDGFDPAVVSVTALSPNRIHVQAISQGVTTIQITDENDETYLVEVFVKGDARHLQAILSSRFPDAAIDAYKVQESVVLTGWVTKPENITQIVEIAEQFFPRVLNQIKVGGVQQVKLRVKVMEVQRSKIRQMGVNFMYLTRNVFLASTPGQLTQLSSLTLPFGSGPSAEFGADTLRNGSVAFGIVNDSNVFQAFLDALKQESLLKILAEPELVTTNGRPAVVLSGGEFPILVPQSLGMTTIEWREFGVRMEAVPIILGNGQLRLELEPEVSERDFTNAVQLNDLTVPGLTVRRVNTQVEMRFGQTLMIAGLISSRRTAQTDKIPYLGDLPWLGTLFSRKRFDEVETELVMLVTPELVAPLENHQVPPGGPGTFTDTPTDKEFYHYQFLEVPNYGDSCEGCELPIIDGGVTPASYSETIMPQPAYPGEYGPAIPQTPPGLIAPPAPAGGNSITPTSATQRGGSRSFLSRVPFFGSKKRTLKASSFSNPYGTSAAGSETSPFSRSSSNTANLPAEQPTSRRRPSGRPGLIEPKSGNITLINP